MPKFEWMLTDQCGLYPSGSTSVPVMTLGNSASLSSALIKSNIYGQALVKKATAYAYSYNGGQPFGTIIGSSAYPEFTISFFAYLIKNESQNCCKGPYFLVGSSTDFTIGVVVKVNEVLLEWFTDSSCTRGYWASPQLATTQKWVHITIAYYYATSYLRMFIDGELFHSENRAIPNKYCKTARYSSLTHL